MNPHYDVPVQLAMLADRKRSNRKLVALTAYDYPSARLLDEAGVDLILVGDSLGMVVLGYEDTTFVTLEEMEHHTRACRRGVSRALLVGDLPFQTYESPEQAVASASRLVEAGAEMVKLEGGAEKAGEVAAIVAEGIPVMGHIGMLPQQVREEGGYKKKGKTPADAGRLLEDAAALERDPENRLLARFNMRRLTAEEVRDSILAVNGTLNRDKMFGPSIFTIIPEEVLAGQSMPGSDDNLR